MPTNLAGCAKRLSLALIILALAGCGGSAGDSTSQEVDGRTIDSTPQKLDGTESHEFEQEDIDQAEDASDAVKDYCAGAVSDAQRLGCESHVTDADLP